MLLNCVGIWSEQLKLGAHMQQPIRRVVLIVLDSVGCGDAPDAADYGDEGANTLANIRPYCGGPEAAEPGPVRSWQLNPYPGCIPDAPDYRGLWPFD